MDQILKDNAIEIMQQHPTIESTGRDFQVSLTKDDDDDDDVQTVADQTASKYNKMSNDNNDIAVENKTVPSRIVQLKNNLHQFRPEKFRENPFLVISDSNVEKKQTSITELNANNNRNDKDLIENIEPNANLVSPRNDVANNLIIEDLIDIACAKEVNDVQTESSFTPRISFNYYNNQKSISEADIHVEYIEQLKSKYYDTMDDAFQINNENCTTSDEPSPTVFRRNRIFPIDELSEHSSRSIASNISLLGEKEREAQLQRIKRASINCSKNRPISRRPKQDSQTKLAWDDQQDVERVIKTESFDNVELQHNSLNSSFSSLSKNDSIQQSSKNTKTIKKPPKAFKPSFHLLLNEKLIFDDETETETNGENSLFSSRKTCTTFSRISEINSGRKAHPILNCSCFSYMISVICSKKTKSKTNTIKIKN